MSLRFCLLECFVSIVRKKNTYSFWFWRWPSQKTNGSKWFHRLFFPDYLSWLRMPRQRLTIWTLVHFHPLEKLRGINVCKGCLVVALQADLIYRFWRTTGAEKVKNLSLQPCPLVWPKSELVQKMCECWTCVLQSFSFAGTADWPAQGLTCCSISSLSFHWQLRLRIPAFIWNQLLYILK